MGSNRFALVVGVSQYGEGLLPLPGSLKDATEVKRILEEPKIGDFQEVDLLENPTSSELSRKAEFFFVDNRTPDDLLLFYFSGHGDLGSSIAHQRLHLCTKDTYRKEDNSLVGTSAMTAHDLNHWMNVSQAKNIVVILDCCYSGYIFNMVRKGETSISYNEFVDDNDPPQDAGRVILAASREDAFQRKGGGLSQYTSCLIEGLKGGAITRSFKLDWIDAQDLHEYLLKCYREKQLLTKPQILATSDQGYKVLVTRVPERDPKDRYSDEVKEVFNNAAKENIYFSGNITIDSIERKTLDIVKDQLGISEEEAQEIEENAQHSFLEQSENRKQYREYFELVYKDCYPFTEAQEGNINLVRKALLSNNEDIISKIEREVLGQIEDDDDDKDGKIILIREFETVKLKIEKKLIFSDFIQTSEWLKSKYFVEYLGDGTNLEMVLIQAGNFWMGSNHEGDDSNPDEYPIHEVEVPSFSIGKTPVTQRQWRKVANLSKIERELNPDPSHFKNCDDCPVEQVSWLEAIEFCQRLSEHSKKNYRLPTESEWEYACRAGTETPFHFGDTIITNLVNFDGRFVYGEGKKGKFRGKTTSVSSFPPNAFGLYDMHGNVWEWCMDAWHENYIGAPIDSSEWYDTNTKVKHRLLRGGSWNYEPESCRSAMRNSSSPDQRQRDIGFRVVCSDLDSI